MCVRFPSRWITGWLTACLALGLLPSTALAAAPKPSCKKPFHYQRVYLHEQGAKRLPYRVLRDAHGQTLVIDETKAPQVFASWGAVNPRDRILVMQWSPFSRLIYGGNPPLKFKASRGMIVEAEHAAFLYLLAQAAQPCGGVFQVATMMMIGSFRKGEFLKTVSLGFLLVEIYRPLTDDYIALQQVIKPEKENDPQAEPFE